MEFTYFLAGVALAVVFCVYKLWELHQAGREDRLNRKAVDLAGEADGAAKREDSTQDGHLQKELRDVPVPWGWPGNGSYHKARKSGHGAVEPGSIQHFVDHLVREKRTTQDEAYRRRLEASMKALLEDRYHSPGQHPERSSERKKGRTVN